MTKKKSNCDTIIFGKKKRLNVKDHHALKSFEIVFDSSKYLNTNKLIDYKAQSILTLR